MGACQVVPTRHRQMEENAASEWSDPYTSPVRYLEEKYRLRFQKKKKGEVIAGSPSPTICTKRKTNRPLISTKNATLRRHARGRDQQVHARQGGKRGGGEHDLSLTMNTFLRDEKKTRGRLC